MIPAVFALKAIPAKPIFYGLLIVFGLHVTGVYPLDLLLTDILSVIATIIEAVVMWVEGVIQDTVSGALPGGS